MKLRNKKTGGIDDFKIEATGLEWLGYTSLKEFCEEWEDVSEEPKEYWIIDTILHEIRFLPYKNNEEDKRYEQWLGELGLKFETKEEAELAIRKLKAWKRMKDKGFRFTGIAGISNNIFVSFETDSKYSGGHIMYDEYSNTDNKLKEYNEDLTLLFGGED